MEAYILHTDGGARGNPGPAAIGGVLKSPDGEVVLEFKEKIGVTTNNDAEYKALVKGLELAAENGVKNLVCVLDSELVVKQINGVYRVKDPNLQFLYGKVMERLNSFEKVIVQHVKRSQNGRADKLVNDALDNK